LIICLIKAIGEFCDAGIESTDGDKKVVLY